MLQFVAQNEPGCEKMNIVYSKEIFDKIYSIQV